MIKHFTLQLTEQEVEALIRTVEADQRDVPMDEESALNRVLTALQSYAD